MVRQLELTFVAITARHYPNSDLLRHRFPFQMGNFGLFLPYQKGLKSLCIQGPQAVESPLFSL